MRKTFIVLLMVFAVAGFAVAQIQAPTSDVLGAHLNYGRGCPACHAPHSGVYGNGGAKTADTTAGNIALWGQDVGDLFGKTIVTGQSEHGSYSETLPASWDQTRPDTAGLLTCLSCHDGNYAQGAMMKNTVWESLPSTYGTYNTIPTLLGADPTGTGNYLNDHPVGTNAIVGCGGTYDWDCTIDATGKILMTGTGSSAFVKNYGFFVSTKAYNNQPTVMCTTCHNQHLMNAFTIKSGATNTGLPAGTYATMFFLRGPYNPWSSGANVNQTAQFCRQCHGGEANEMNGGLTIPTTF
jgi:nitrate/TMAO reductase-like tetraheme cytochrome c subunit